MKNTSYAHAGFLFRASGSTEQIFLRSLEALLVGYQRNHGVEALLLALLLLRVKQVRVLGHTCLFLAEVACQSSQNSMDASHLTVVLAPKYLTHPTRPV